VLVSFAGIVGTRIAPEPALATLPISLSVLGIASFSLPTALLMQRIGRKPAFMASATVAALAALLCAVSIARSDFIGLCVAAFFIGGNMAFVQQYRFAAIEYVTPELAGKAVATVMIGTLGAALLGPTLGQQLRLIGDWPEYTGSFVMLSVLCLCAVAVLSRLPRTPLERHSESPAGGRTISVILRQPTYRLAVVAGLASYAVMSFIMTATPLSMHVHDGYSSAETTTVITAHLLGMYLPSLASPWITRTLGIRRMMILGVLINVVCVLISAGLGREFIHYFSALFLLGVGWNLMFVAATAMLSNTYAPEERFRAQGTNDLLVFGSQAMASLLAGTAIETLGWEVLNLITLPVLFWVLWSMRPLTLSRS
jgi:MFS family permease